MHAASKQEGNGKLHPRARAPLSLHRSGVASLHQVHPTGSLALRWLGKLPRIQCTTVGEGLMIDSNLQPPAVHTRAAAVPR